MPTPTLTRIDLSDPAPPIPGDRERAAVRARATQITRRRRVVQGGAVLSVLALVGVVGVVLTAGGSGSAPVAILEVSSTTLEPTSTVTVDLKNEDGSFVGVADADGTVQFDVDIAPGTYEAFVTVESPPGVAEDGVDIGTALDTDRSIMITLEAGENTLDLDTLTIKN